MKKMKTITKISMVCLCTLGLMLATSCTKDFEEMNTNPKIVTAELIDPGLILTYVEWNGVIANASNGNGTYGSFCGMCKRDDDAPFREFDAPGAWNFAYTNQLNNLSNIIQLMEGKENKDELVNKIAIARILKAWAVSILTDVYGDVPYSESCLPQDQAVYGPKYDTQQSIYEHLFIELKDAAAQLDATKPSYGAADLIYAGNVDKWRKLANSLRLRMALRVRYADENLARTQMSDLTEAGLITTLADDATMKHNTAYNTQMNPRYYRIINYNSTSESVHAHMVMTNILKNDTINLDPRIGIYVDTVMAPFKGGLSPNGYFFPNYLYRGSPTLGMVEEKYKYPWNSPTVSEISEFWRVPVSARSVMKCSEVYFSLAEAKLTGLLPAGFTGTANSYYQKGIDAGIDWAKWYYDLAAPQISDLMIKYIHNPVYGADSQWTAADVQEYLEYKSIKDEAITAYKATPIYTLSGTNEQQLEMIINQKIVALYPDEFQGWCEYRRSGYPKIPIGPDTAPLHGVVPRREPWPTVEETINSVSFDEALARYSTDSRLTKFWWDANPNAPHIYVWTAPWMEKGWQ
jgi:Starch-binding associating with outer membrane